MVRTGAHTEPFTNTGRQPNPCREGRRKLTSYSAEGCDGTSPPCYPSRGHVTPSDDIVHVAHRILFVVQVWVTCRTSFQSWCNLDPE